MHGPVVDPDIDTPPIMLLLVEDVVLRARHHAAALDSLDGLGHGDAGEIRVGAAVISHHYHQIRSNLRIRYERDKHTQTPPSSSPPAAPSPAARTPGPA
jgi:hypothetical protein